MTPCTVLDWSRLANFAIAGTLCNLIRTTCTSTIIAVLLFTSSSRSAIPAAYDPYQPGVSEYHSDSHGIPTSVTLSSTGMTVEYPNSSGVDVTYHNARPLSRTPISIELLPSRDSRLVPNLDNPPLLTTASYEDVYPGIDLHFSDSSSQLKSTWTLDPGHSPDVISWSYTGAFPSIRAGRLLVFRPHSSPGIHDRGRAPLWEESRPLAWQELDNSTREVDVQYLLNQDASVSFTVGDYDPSYPLVIDPTYEFSTFLGGSSGDSYALTDIGSDGSIYFVGATRSTDFPTLQPIQPARAGQGFNYDLFLGRMTPDGQQLLWSTYLGGSGDDIPSDLRITPEGILIVTGSTQSADFPLHTPIQPALQGTADAFVFGIHDDGQALAFSTLLGGSATDSGTGVAARRDGSVMIVGVTESTDFPIVNGAQRNMRGVADGFLAALSPHGTNLTYSSYFGGSGRDHISGLTVHADNSPLFVGNTDSADFPAQGGVMTVRTPRVGDFLCKTTEDLQSFDFCTYLGGSQATDVTVTTESDIVVVGTTSNPDFPLVNHIQEPHIDRDVSPDAYVMKLNSTATSRLFSSPLGGRYLDSAYAVDSDALGLIYVFGSTRSPDFPLAYPLDSTLGGSSDAFVSVVDPFTPRLLVSSFVGGGNGEQMTSSAHGSIQSVGEGRAVISGRTSSADFPTVKAILPNHQGVTDSFVSRLDLRTPSPTPTPSSSPTPQTASNEPIVCDFILQRVPASVINVAVSNPEIVAGWGELCFPNRPEGPFNRLRRTLSIRNAAAPYHPLFNPPVFKCGCP